MANRVSPAMVWMFNLARSPFTMRFALCEC